MEEIKCTNTLCVMFSDSPDQNGCSWDKDSDFIKDCSCRIDAEKIKNRISELEIIITNFIETSLCENCGNEMSSYPCDKCGFDGQSIK